VHLVLYTELAELLDLKTILEFLLVLVGLVPNALTRSTLEINCIVLRHIIAKFRTNRSRITLFCQGY
jgi:hypothetical protein